MSELKFPTEEVELPSKGLIYPKDNPLSSGKIEMKYMTAREEDILTNQNYIKQGIVIDKLLFVSEFGDKPYMEILQKLPSEEIKDFKRKGKFSNIDELGYTLALNKTKSIGYDGINYANKFIQI